MRDAEECCLYEKQDAKKALITATSDEGISLIRTCAAKKKDKQPVAKFSDDAILTTSICEERLECSEELGYD